MWRPQLTGGLTIEMGAYAVTRVTLPGRPAGLCGIVREIGPRFILLEFEDGQKAYYLPCQVRPPSSQTSDPSAS
jgi:hypothetical protein